MLVTSAVPPLATLLLSTATAAPTRTHCRCTVVANAPPVFSPSVAHWTPAQSSPSPTAADICANLGPELENFQHTEPDFYDSYLARTKGQPESNDQQRPLTDKVLVTYATGNELRASEAANSEPRPTSRPHPRIVCRSESEPFTAYQDSFTTLWVLQIIIAIAILACIVEGVHLSMRWYGAAHDLKSNSQIGAIRLPGSSRLILEIIKSDSEATAGEKMQTSEATPMLIVQAPNGERVCIGYEEEEEEEEEDDDDDDDDDEIYRPVM